MLQAKPLKARKLLATELTASTLLTSPSFVWDAAVQDIKGGAGFTFARASDATYWDSDGLLKTANDDEARYEYDPATGNFIGYLSENAGTQLITYSDLPLTSTSGWSGTVTNSVNATIANPTGALGVVELDDATAAAQQGINTVAIAIPGSVTQQACFSVYIKKDFSPTGEAAIRLRLRDGVPSEARVRIQLDTGETTEYSGTAVNHGAVDCGDFWRAWVIVESGDAANLNANCYIYPHYQTAGIQTIYVWGAQLETADHLASATGRNAYASSYMSRPDATAFSRAADSLTSTDVSWYNQGGSGTLSVTCSYPSSILEMFPDSERFDYYQIMKLWDSATPTSELIGVPSRPTYGTEVLRMKMRNDGSSENFNCVTTFRFAGANIPSIMTTTWNATEGRISTDGVNVGATRDTTADIPTSIDSIGIGQQHNTSYNANGHVRKIEYWAQHIDLTTLNKKSSGY